MDSSQQQQLQNFWHQAQSARSADCAKNLLRFSSLWLTRHQMAWSWLYACIVVTKFVMTIVANPAVEPVSLQQQTTRKSDFVNKAPADPETLHELVFAVKQQNIELLDSMLIERSTPGSQVYQQWMTHEEVGNITSNLEASHAVIDWLEQSEVEVLWTSLRLEYIKAVAKISKWDELLSAEFSVIDTPKRQSKRARTENKKAPLLHRTKVYNLPSEIKHHIQAVFSAVESPAIESSKPDIKPTTEALPVESQVGRKLNNLRTNNANAATAMKVVLDGTVTIPFLNQLYKIPANIGDATQQQMVFETNEEMYAPADLELFQQHFNLPSQTVVDHSPSPHSTTDCVNQTCAQSNADLQYLTGMAQGTRTEYFYAPAVGSTDPFVAWITSVADMEEPPLVHSITWSIPERMRSKGVLDAFNTEALKLAIMGVTIVVASGRNGAAGGEELCEVSSGSAGGAPYWTGAPWSGVGYFPSFPATSPYVTAVGATMGPESGDPEIACQSQLSGVITTGGGFSTYYPTPSWQTEAVSLYFASLSADHQPTSGYNPNGRGYPDVSLVGNKYQVFIAGALTYYYGTAAAADVFAAMVSLANAQRARQGRPSLGFLNPTLYASPGAFNDVTSGHNKCMSSVFIEKPSDAHCCDSGFHAAAGWDPVTGLGSLTFDVLESMAFVNSFEREGGDDKKSTSVSLSAAAIFGIVLGGLVSLAVVALLVMLLQSWTAKSTQVAPSPYTIVYRRGADGMDFPVAYVITSSNSFAYNCK